jgi:TPR repeat protein
MAARALTCLSLCLISLLSFAEVDRGVDAYERGKHSIALRYWMPLARNGNALAQNNLGVMYQRGLGVAQDFRKAHSWFEKAAAQELAEANVNLGLLYFDGLGVSQDQQKAFSLFSIAAREKLPEAYHMLGLQLYSGTGVPVDLQEALQYFKDAAVLGYPESQYMLAYMYQSGDLGKERADLAYVWSKIAGDYSNLEIARDLNYLTTLLLDDDEQAEQALKAEACFSSNFRDCPF